MGDEAGYNIPIVSEHLEADVKGRALREGPGWECCSEVASILGDLLLFAEELWMWKGLASTITVMQFTDTMAGQQDLLSQPPVFDKISTVAEERRRPL